MLCHPEVSQLSQCWWPSPYLVSFHSTGKKIASTILYPMGTGPLFSILLSTRQYHCIFYSVDNLSFDAHCFSMAACRPWQDPAEHYCYLLTYRYTVPEYGSWHTAYTFFLITPEFHAKHNTTVESLCPGFVCKATVVAIHHSLYNDMPMSTGLMKHVHSHLYKYVSILFPTHDNWPRGYSVIMLIRSREDPDNTPRMISIGYQALLGGLSSECLLPTSILKRSSAIYRVYSLRIPLRRFYPMWISILSYPQDSLADI